MKKLGTTLTYTIYYGAITAIAVMAVGMAIKYDHTQVVVRSIQSESKDVAKYLSANCERGIQNKEAMVIIGESIFAVDDYKHGDIKIEELILQESKLLTLQSNLVAAAGQTYFNEMGMKFDEKVGKANFDMMEPLNVKLHASKASDEDLKIARFDVGTNFVRNSSAYSLLVYIQELDKKPREVDYDVLLAASDLAMSLVTLDEPANKELYKSGYTALSNLAVGLHDFSIKVIDKKQLKELIASTETVTASVQAKVGHAPVANPTAEQIVAAAKQASEVRAVKKPTKKQRKTTPFLVEAFRKNVVLQGLANREDPKQMRKAADILILIAKNFVEVPTK